MMTKKILFLLTFLLTTLGGGNSAWAADYKPTATHTFTTTQDIIVTENNPVLVAGKTDGWIKIPSEDYGSKTPATDSEMDTPTTSVSCLRTKMVGDFTSKSRVIHFRVTGITGVKAIGNVNGHTSFGIGATEYSSSVTEINKVVMSGGDVVSHTGLDKSKTYIISIFSVTDDDQFLYAVRFYSDPYETNIGIGDLCYAVGTGGKNAKSQGLDRAVGGFNLTFGGGDGIKYNGANQLLARYTGTITIALDNNNSKKNIKKVVFTKSSAGDGTFTASDNTNPTNSGTTITWEGTACKTITFTHSDADFLITNIAITTDVTPVFEKVTPTVTIDPTSASVKKGTAGTFTTTATSSPKNFNWTWTPTALTNVGYYTKNDGGTKTANQIGEPGTFETSTSSTTTGNNTLVASFAGNDYFEAVPTAATYTLSIYEPVASTPDNTFKTYPYTWNFANGSSTWGNSSTQLPASDWIVAENNASYYHYSVPDALTGFNIDAIKGLRFQNIGYLGLDWNFGHIWSTAGTITIPNVPFGMTIQIVAQNRNDSNPATTITPTNATYTGEGTATLGTEYTTYTFTSTATGTDVSFVFSGKSSIKSIAVLKTAIPHKWDFETSTYWSTTRGGLNASYWVESSDVANNPDEVMSNVAFSGEELTKDGTNKIPEMEGLVMTAVKGSSRFKIGKYYRLGNYSKASITIPSMTTGQTVTFKVETATAGMERGITATSSNLELISGQVSDKVSYYTFRVTSDGDGEFRQTSEVAGLKIYYIDLKAASPAATELKFVDGSNNDISNKKVNIVSGSVTGALDSYFTLAQGGSVGWANVTVTVSPSDLITYNNNGTFTMGSGTGTATITASTTDGSVETGIAVLYVSVKNQPTVTLSANGPFSVNYGQDFNGGTSTVTGTPNVGSLTVKYKSSNERVATVNASGKVTCVGVGTATITAYTEETETYLPAEASYQVTYNAGNVVFQFEPSEVKLALGKNITPFLHYNQGGQLDASTLSYSVSKSDIVTCQVVADDKQSDKNVIKITSLDDASKIGETVIVTASATMKNTSVVYNTTIAVTITAEDAVNFDWVNGDDIYVYENTYFPIPGYNGNASGNNHFSNGPDNKSTYHAYYYSISNGSVTWNKENYKLNEGVPDYSIANDTGEALIFWGYSDNNLTGDTLLVFAKTAGTVKLHAVDSQSGVECTPITIHILPKSELDAAHNAELNTISFPYTWDFTKNISDNDFANSMFWEEDNQGRYTNTAAWMNQDWADVLSGITRYSINFMGGSAEGSPMVLFKGLQIQLGNTTFASKIARLRVSPNAGEGQPHLYINGGPHTITLPRPGYINPNTGFQEPENYQLIFKLKTGEKTEVNVNVNGTNTAYKSFEDKGVAPNITANSDVIIRQNIARGQTVTLGIGNADVYWIAMSTEAKILNYYKGTNPHLTYAAAAYSYNEDLDLTKSNEVNGGAAYYASSFTTDNNKDAGAFADDGNQYAVVMTPLTTMGNYVTANTGMLLKYDNVSEYTTDTQIPFYMIANPRNVETYSATETINGTTHKNYLVGTGSGISSLSGHESIESTEYTNFLMAAAYKYYTDVTKPNTAQGDYRFDRDWSFYPIVGEGPVPAQRSYLHIPGNLYVNTSGQIVDMPTSARAAFDVDSAADETAEAPATKGALNIVFEDEMPATPDDPATEEPEDGDSDKDKDRPRKPGDDGWPKPPFPPFPPIITDIDSVNTETTDNAVWHSMEGVRISQPTKPGLYIRNGKKIVIK